MENMNIENLVKVAIELLAKQEGVEIKYTLSSKDTYEEKEASA